MVLMGVAAADPDLVLEEQAEFKGIIDDLGKARQELVDGFDSLVERFNDIWTGPIDWFKRTVFDRGEHQDQRDAIEQIRRHLFGGDPGEGTQFTADEGGEGGINELAEKMVEHHTPVLSLFIMSSRWVTDTKKETSNMWAHLWGRRTAATSRSGRTKLGTSTTTSSLSRRTRFRRSRIWPAS